MPLEIEEGYCLICKKRTNKSFCSKECFDVFRFENKIMSSWERDKYKLRKKK